MEPQDHRQSWDILKTPGRQPLPMTFREFMTCIGVGSWAVTGFMFVCEIIAPHWIDIHVSRTQAALFLPVIVAAGALVFHWLTVNGDLPGSHWILRWLITVGALSSTIGALYSTSPSYVYFLVLLAVPLAMIVAGSFKSPQIRISGRALVGWGIPIAIGYSTVGAIWILLGGEVQTVSVAAVFNVVTGALLISVISDRSQSLSQRHDGPSR